MHRIIAKWFTAVLPFVLQPTKDKQHNAQEDNHYSSECLQHNRVLPLKTIVAAAAALMDSNGRAAGDDWIAGLIGVSVKDQPSLLIGGEPALSPWIGAERVQRQGMLIVWDATGSGFLPP